MNTVSTHIRQAALAAVCAVGLLFPVLAQHGVAKADGDPTVGSPDLSAVVTTVASRSDQSSTANPLPSDFVPIITPIGD